ncbi:hypothetical protein [Pedobacter nanyangensis]|uniref:hypothetical protein n=1 Tax=Pedobacter nanyangensis TaxID=1562389 RepID=UPI000DE1D3FF|nr:hypothetical protein [Pedobacter nanyangensis]
MPRKKIRTFTIALTLIIQLLFLSAIFMEKLQNVYTPFAIIVLSLLLLISYIKVPIHHRTNLHEHVLIVLWIPAGALACYALNNVYHLGPVIAAGIVGTSASFIPLLNKKSTYLKQLPATFYCGAFIGMTNIAIASSVYFVLAASFFAGVLLLVSKSLFNGLGGKLGTVAFTAVTITSFIFFLLFKK